MEKIIFESSKPMTVGELVEALKQVDQNLKVAPVHEEFTLEKTLATSVRIDEDGDVEIT